MTWVNSCAVAAAVAAIVARPSRPHCPARPAPLAQSAQNQKSKVGLLAFWLSQGFRTAPMDSSRHAGMFCFVFRQSILTKQTCNLEYACSGFVFR